MKNKHGWIKIIEAFVAVLLITGVALIIINRGYVGDRDISSKVYEFEKAVLREIQLNNSLRNDVLINEPSQSLNDIIRNKTPNYLACAVRKCRLDEECNLDTPINKDVYVQSAIISANLTTYNPRQLRLFCWEKN